MPHRKDTRNSFHMTRKMSLNSTSPRDSARITETEFQSKFQGKKLFAGDDKSKVALSVVKKGKEGDLSADNYVNGITGATLTSDGVNNMIQKCLNDYQDILESLKK